MEIDGQIMSDEIPVREVNSHCVGSTNDAIKIIVNDTPGSGGANHRYEITGFDTADNPSNKDPQGFASSFSRQVILFQNGPVNESGANGITQEVLIAICIDRLKSFQDGPYSCRDNEIALTHLEEALMWLQKRTLDRVRRGVEGTSKK